MAKQPSLDELIVRISEHKADGEYLEHLFARSADAPRGLRLSLSVLDEQEGTRFVDAVFDHYLPWSWPLAWRLFEIRSELPSPICSRIEALAVEKIPANSESLKSRLDAAKSENGSLNPPLKKAYALLDNLGRDRVSLEGKRAELADLQARIDRHTRKQEELKAMERKYVALREQLEKIEQEAGEEDLERLRNQLGSWRDNWSADQIGELAGELDELKQLLDESPDNPRSLVGRIRRLRAGLKRFEAEP